MIEVREYDPAWPARAAAEIAAVTGALPGVFGAVEHVGSTAVPGLAAKPVIDLMAAAADLEAVVDREAPLASLGYTRVETGMTGRLFYRRDGHHLHVVPESTWDTRNERLLREHLLAHPDDRDDYARLKGELAGATGDGMAYTRGKTALIQRLIDRARTDRGLPLVDVWED